MKTLIIYKDGSSELFEGATPSVYIDEVSLLNLDAEIIYDPVPLNTVAKIEFEND